MLAVLWGVATVGIGALLFLDLKDYASLGWLAGIAFIVALIWHLSRIGLPVADLPDLSPIVLPRLGFWGMLGSIIVSLVLLFALGILVHPWIVLVVVFALVALGIIIAWRRRLSLRLVVLGLGAGLVVSVADLATRYLSTGDLSFHIWLYLPSVPLLFIAGGLLLEHTGLTYIRLLEGRYVLGLRGFLWACVLALPPALLNILSGTHRGDTAIQHWWDPLYALVPGIAEETWARLFLTTLCYALLRPTVNDRPRRAVVAAILVGAFAHALAHLSTLAILSPAVIGMVIAGLLYGVPMALLFVKRDLEHAVGYHFFIDFVRFLAALVQL